MIVVDDHFIAAGLASGRSPAGAEAMATTCSWWWRLSSALAGGRGGALSAHFSEAGGAELEALRRTVAGLARRIQILDLRDLIPAMALLSGEHALDLMAAEAVVAAEVLGADLVVMVDAPKIRQAAEARGVSYRVL